MPTDVYNAVYAEYKDLVLTKIQNNVTVESFHTYDWVKVSRRPISFWFQEVC